MLDGNGPYSPSNLYILIKLVLEAMYFRVGAEELVQCWSGPWPALLFSHRKVTCWSANKVWLTRGLVPDGRKAMPSATDFCDMDSFNY